MPPIPPKAPLRKPPKLRRKSSDYRIITMSVYEVDIAVMDRYVAHLKACGFRKSSRSMLVRHMLRTLRMEPFVATLHEKGIS